MNNSNSKDELKRTRCFGKERPQALPSWSHTNERHEQNLLDNHVSRDQKVAAMLAIGRKTALLLNLPKDDDHTEWLYDEKGFPQ